MFTPVRACAQACHLAATFGDGRYLTATPRGYSDPRSPHHATLPTHCTSCVPRCDGALVLHNCSPYILRGTSTHAHVCTDVHTCVRACSPPCTPVFTGGCIHECTGVHSDDATVHTCALPHTRARAHRCARGCTLVCTGLHGVNTGVHL